MEKRARILVAEDSRTQAEMIGYILEESGYDFRIASDGKKALREIPGFDPELVISDVIMPEMNGHELCKRLKANEATRDVPVLLLTSLAGPEDILAGLESGADSYLMKPYDEKILLEKIELLLQKSGSSGNKPGQKTYKFIVEKASYELKTSRRNMLDMLLAVCDSAIQDNRKLQTAQEDLSEINATLEERVEESTRTLQEKLELGRSMEELLEKNRERYTRLAHSANVGIILVDLDGRIEFANAAMAKILDTRSEKDLGGSDFSTYFSSKEEYNEIFERLRSSGKLHDEELKLYTPKRMPRWVTMNLVRQEDRISGMIFDKTGKKFLHERDLHYREVLRNTKENAERSDRQKSFFLKGMANQVKGPLNQVSAYASLLAEAKPGDLRARSYKNRISLNVFELRNKISHMLDLSKIEAGQVRPIEKELPVVQKCREVCEEYRQILKLMGREEISIRCRTEAIEEQAVIITDSSLFIQIVRILIDNAVGFSERGNIDVIIKRMDDNLEVHIRDEGPGIGKERLEEIIRKAGNGNYLEDNQELGLGLHVAKKLVEMLKGKLHALSAPGKGSDFFFSMPLKEKKQDSFQEDVEELAYYISHLSDKTIMVAEDMYDNYVLLSAYLEHTGARLIWVKNGEEAIRKFESGTRIDMILMDIKMPVKDGFQAIRAIRVVNKQIPIIAVTAFESPEHRSKVKELGVNAFISKPVEQNELLETLSDCFAGNKQTIENG